MGIFLSAYLMVILMAIIFYYLVTTYSVKISAFLIDFVLVGFAIFFAVREKIELKYSVPISLFGIFVYGIILITVNQKLPKASKFLNYIIAFIGASVALWLALDFGSNLLYAIGILERSFYQIPVTSNKMVNTFINYVLVFFISIPVYKGRMRVINGE